MKGSKCESSCSILRDAVFSQIDFALQFYSPSNNICSILPYEWNNNCPQIVFTVIACALYRTENFSIHCLKQKGIAADEASHISLLSAETLAAPDDDDDDPSLTSDYEDELETNELSVEDTHQYWFHLVTYFFTQQYTARKENDSHVWA